MASRIKIDLHPVYDNNKEMMILLKDAFNEAFFYKKELEIITGKGSGQLKKKILRLLQQEPFKGKYKQIIKDSKNFGRIFVRF